MDKNEHLIRARQLSIFDYFNTLQLEWICADIRTRIYERPKDIQYWEFVKNGKKAKIENISTKNLLPTIFDDSAMREEFYRKIVTDKGFPKFIYKNDAQRAQQEFFDMSNYFRKNVDIRCEIDGEIVVCKIRQYEPYQIELHAKRLDNNEPVVLKVKECSRII